MTQHQPDLVTLRIGTEAQPIAVIDGFHPDPEALRAAAARARFEPGRHHYPGIRAALPPDYFARTNAAIATALRDVFGYGASASVIDASFSIVTTAPDQLTVAQRLPHVDAVDANRIALVHYLDPAGGDGTAFFRHRETGFETIDAARSPGYFASLDRALADAPPTPGYIRGDTALFERTAAIDAKYNRAVLYRSALLHSGAIAPDAALADDPLRGRLTVTAFLAAR